VAAQEAHPGEGEELREDGVDREVGAAAALVVADLAATVGVVAEDSALVVGHRVVVDSLQEGGDTDCPTVHHRRLLYTSRRNVSINLRKKEALCYKVDYAEIDFAVAGAFEDVDDESTGGSAR